MSQDVIVYIVDDDPDVRNSLRFLLESVQFRTQSFATAHEFLEAYRPTQPGCLLLDVRMPGMSGLDLQTHLSNQHVGIPIIIVTGHGDVPMAVRALKTGAFDFIEKPFNDEVLLNRVQQAVRVDRERLERERSHSEIKNRVAELTPREQEVMRLVVDGKSNKIIADLLGLSPKTVEVHRAHVMDKMKADSLADLVRLSLEARHAAAN